MHLHSTLEGRAGAFRLRGAAWSDNSLSFRGFVYLVPLQGGGDGRHLVVEGEGESMWKLLEALGEQVIQLVGAPVQRLDAHAVARMPPASDGRRGRVARADVSGSVPTH
jgi:hypothetical protein